MRTDSGRKTDTVIQGKDWKLKKSQTLKTSSKNREIDIKNGYYKWPKSSKAKTYKMTNKG